VRCCSRLRRVPTYAVDKVEPHLQKAACRGSDEITNGIGRQEWGRSRPCRRRWLPTPSRSFPERNLQSCELRIDHRAPVKSRRVVLWSETLPLYYIQDLRWNMLICSSCSRLWSRNRRSGRPGTLQPVKDKMTRAIRPPHDNCVTQGDIQNANCLVAEGLTLTQHGKHPLFTGQ
jgi:hypothetical protein